MVDQERVPETTDRKRTVRRLVVAALLAALVVSAALVAAGMFRDPLKHDTDRWAVVADTHGDRIAVETTNATVWDQLVAMKANGTRLWVGGVPEAYDNAWGFRFRPDSIVIAEVTAEGLQATIKDISKDLSYWRGLGTVYIDGAVLAVHTAAA